MHVLAPDAERSQFSRDFALCLFVYLLIYLNAGKQRRGTERERERAAAAVAAAHELRAGAVSGARAHNPESTGATADMQLALVI